MQNSNYKLFIFDMDGTLLDTSPGIVQAVRYTLDVYNKKIPNDTVLKTFIGPPLRVSFSALTDVVMDEVDDMVKTFRKQYSDQELFHANVYEGVYQLCECLQSNDIKIAVATNKPEKFANELVQYFNLDKYISIVCGADEQGMLTKADLIRRVIKLTQLDDKRKVVMVGDTLGDAYAALECGIDFIGVTYGFGLSGNKEELVQTKYVLMASSPLEIYKGELS